MSYADDRFSLEKGKRVSRCLEYLSFIEKFTGDLTFILRDESIVDHVYMKRLKVSCVFVLLFLIYNGIYFKDVVRLC